MRKNAYSQPDLYTDKLNLIGNLDFSGGVMLMLISYATSTKIFNGRRITAMVLCILVLIFWDIIWVSFTDIYDDKFTDHMHGRYYAKDFLLFD